MNEFGGPANSSKFIMRINPKGQSWLGQTAAQNTGDLIFFTDSVNLPGKSYVFSEVRRHGYGPLERRPTTQFFSELTATIILDRKGNNLGLFNRWMDFILGSEDLMMETKNELIDFYTGGQGYAYELAYPISYLTDIDIFILDQHLSYGTQIDPETNSIAHYKLYDAYPAAVGDIDLNWNNNNTIARIPVTFQYKFWQAVQHNVSTGAGDAVSAGTTNDSGLPNLGFDIAIGPGGIEAGVTATGSAGSVRVGTSGVTGTLRSGIGDISLDPTGRVTTTANIPLGVTTKL